MSADEIIARVRDHYVDQFRAFARRQQQSCTRGAAEVKMQLSERSRLFQRLYCADFIKNDESAAVIEFKPDRVLSFPTISGRLGGATLLIEQFRWDDAVFNHDAGALLPEQLRNWFDHWFDPEDHRASTEAEVSNVIHSMLVESGLVSVDFGTAVPEALWEMLAVLEGAGATAIRLSSPAPNPTQ
jgi:hypothetical protein